eukprot:TRINITY_DN12184_c0_g1_i4.p1 TRINITY_DN12184_c0_g1~~TRINITY_DN12184_c0_g1_i4.p1  ORF type:complete len:143 (-),score=38.39 TRINITY_DN12184_c0_g1_i4:68-496(-)
MIRRPPRSTLSSSSAASDVYKRQHQYKNEDINSFANFYTDFFDGVLMNISFIGFGLAVWFTGQGHIVHNEFVVVAFLSHHKYGKQLMGPMYFYEYDVVDIVCGRERLSRFHATHHHELNKFFSAFGTLSDDFFRRWVYTGKK